MCSKHIFCSKVARKGKICSRLPEPQKVAPNAKRCSKVAEHIRERPTSEWNPEYQIYLRPVSNAVLLPCRTQLIELNSTLARQYSATIETKSCYCRVARQALPCYMAVAPDLVSNVVLPPCRTQFIKYKCIRIHFKVS